ncbi:uncharacterized protein LOC107474900 [Arachis duranensis]|uniref:Uncharacterized protein LOC107474900 n=1 Tax=Arachis duranensis TaxID=130453 RepID=A0A6P4CFI9_ARADU|nr:uncharacterized protein LOC107474900 [Arachis duranensis]
MPLDFMDSSSDNNDDVGPTSDRRKRKTTSDNDNGKKNVINDEDTCRPPSIDASDYEKEIDGDENEENLQLSFSDDSWKSDELKTPLDSKDEADPATNPIFNDTAKFGHVRLELSMEFTTRGAFKKGVRNYTLQEGRGVRTTITRALGDERKIVRGDEAAEYAKLKDYTEELLRSNLGSTVKLGVSPMPNGEGVFERFYVCLHGCKKGFVGGCRPLIGLDGTFLKTYYAGWLLCAIGQDVNNHVYPIAWAIVHIESKDNWKWFLELLHEDIGDQTEHGWCFISDMQKSIKSVNGKAWAYLDKFSRQAWTRAHYKDFPKVDNVCNNMCEVFNAATKPYRCKPVLTLLEEVRRLAKERHYSRYYTPIWSGDAAEVIFEVHGEPHNVVVDLGNQTCSCRSWQLLEYLHCLPPVRSKPRGRPSPYARKKDAHETPVRGSQERTAKKLKRKYGKFTCVTCGDVGHTTRSCRIAKKQKADELAAAAKGAEDAANKSD